MKHRKKVRAMTNKLVLAEKHTVYSAMTRTLWLRVNRLIPEPIWIDNLDIPYTLVSQRTLSYETKNIPSC